MTHNLNQQEPRVLQRLLQVSKPTVSPSVKGSPMGVLTSFKCFAMKQLVNLSNIASTGSNLTELETVLFDSGANCCVTNHQSDFTSTITKHITNRCVDGIGKGLKIDGTGVVSWTFKADNGMYRTLRLPCYYVPSSNTRIASLQTVLEAYPNETFSMNQNHLTLSGHGKTPSITIAVCSQSKLPMGITAKPTTPAVYKREVKPPRDHLTNTKGILPAVKHPSLTAPSNLNLSEPEKELLRWHHQLGHVNIKQVQWLMRQGILTASEVTRRLHNTAAKLTHGPLCTACQFAKQRRKTMPGSVKRMIKPEAGALKKDTLFPGQLVSVDHFHCNPLGRLLHTYGKESADKKYGGGCIFVDHATSLVYVELQSSLNSHQTLAAKKSYEQPLRRTWSDPSDLPQ